MKTALWRLLTTAVAVLAFTAGCEWESADSFNTSRGAGANVNFSGVYSEYKPEHYADSGASGPGGAIVSGTSITRLVLTQNGNALDVLDNHNNYYRGSVGSPGVVTPPNETGGYPAGAELVQSQISFGGGDVQFVGVLRAVAVTDIEGEQIIAGRIRDDSKVESSTDSETETDGTSPDTTTETVTVTVQGDTTTTTTTTTTGGSSEYSQDTETRSESEGDLRTDQDAYAGQWVVDESGTMYVLEGNWIQGGTAREVRAWSHGGAVIVTTSPETPPDWPSTTTTPEPTTPVPEPTTPTDTGDAGLL